MWRPRTELLLVGGLALLLRLAAFAAADRPAEFFHRPDSEEYDRLAWNLVAHGAYSLEESAPWTPDLTRTPVFPLFVAGCYSLAGHRPALAVLAQVGFAVATVLLLGALGRRFFTAPAALAGAALLALDPSSIRFATLLLSETLFTSLFLGSLFCLLAYLRTPGWGWLTAAALLTGLAILCRPIAVFWPAALLPGALLVARRERRWRPLGHYLVFLLAVAAVVGPWVVRNACVGGLPVLTTVRGINLYYHRAAAVVAERQGVSFDEAQSLLARRLREAVEREHLTPAQEYRLMERSGEEIIAAAPREYLGAQGHGMTNLFLPEPRRLPIPGLSLAGAYWLEIGFLTVVYGLGLVGLGWGLCRPGRLRFLLLSAVLVYFAVLSGPEAYDRFRVPLMPAIALLAGVGLTALSAPLRRQLPLLAVAAGPRGRQPNR